MALRPRQTRFVAEYLRDLNATQAAIRAGYSKKTAESQASRLLRNVKVAAEVASRQQKVATRLDLSAEKVLADISRLSALAAAAEDFGPALRGQELLGKHLKLFTEKVEHSGDVCFRVVTGVTRGPDGGDMP